MFRHMNMHFDHLPVWINGNAYFNGAKAYKEEEFRLVDGENRVHVELEERDGKLFLDTNVYEFLKEFRTGIINSDILGCAFEPEERFENPDGTDIIFTEDYFDEHRGSVVYPGPFASAEEIDWPLY